MAFVTGAGGFLGGAAARALGAAGWRVAGFGHAPGSPEGEQAVGGLAGWSEGDVRQDLLASAARELGRPEVLFHAAGGASVAASMADPTADRARTLGSLEETLAFLKAEAPGARLVYPSSAAVYGAQAGPLRESRPLAPISPYGEHKVAAEAAIAESGVPAAIIRFFSLYGPGLRKQLPWELAGRLAQRPARLELSGTGEEVRDFLFVDDAARLVGMAAALEPGAAPLIVNGGSGRPTTVRALAEGLRDALGVDCEIGFSGLARPGDPPILLADVTELGSIGFRPAVGLAQGLGRLAAWFRAAA